MIMQLIYCQLKFYKDNSLEFFLCSVVLSSLQVVSENACLSFLVADENIFQVWEEDFNELFVWSYFGGL